MAQVPLVVLTADRPLELQGWGAPQTVPQARLFGRVRAARSRTWALPEASDVALLHLRATGRPGGGDGAARAAGRRAPQRAVPRAARAHAGGLRRGARCPRWPERAGRGAAHAHRAARAPAGRRRAGRGARAGWRSHRAGRHRLRPAGRGATASRRPSPRSREATGYPVLAEATSQARYGGGRELRATVSHYDALLRARALRPGAPAGAGAALRRRADAQGAAGSGSTRSGAEVVLFSDEGALFDPAHRAARVMEGSAVAACEALSRGLSRGLGPLGPELPAGRALARAALEAAFAEDESLTEPRIAREVVAALPAGANLFVSSSMPIRDVDAFAPGERRPLRVLANRGANGIDGIVSSALGVAAASGRPTVLLTGDLAFLHDVGGLLTARRRGLLAHGGGGEQRRGRHLLLPAHRAGHGRALRAALRHAARGGPVARGGALRGAASTARTRPRRCARP